MNMIHITLFLSVACVSIDSIIYHWPLQELVDFMV